MKSSPWDIQPSSGRVRSQTAAVRIEKIAYSVAACAAVLACLPAAILMFLGYSSDFTVRWMLIIGGSVTAVAGAVSLWLRHKRLNDRIMLQDLRVGSTVSRGVSPLGRTRNHMGVSPASAFIVMSALALAMGGLAFVYINLWDY